MSFQTRSLVILGYLRCNVESVRLYESQLDREYISKKAMLEERHIRIAVRIDGETSVSEFSRQVKFDRISIVASGVVSSTILRPRQVSLTCSCDPDSVHVQAGEFHKRFETVR